MLPAEVTPQPIHSVRCQDSVPGRHEIKAGDRWLRLTRRSSVCSVWSNGRMVEEPGGKRATVAKSGYGLTSEVGVFSVVNIEVDESFCKERVLLNGGVTAEIETEWWNDRPAEC